MKRTAESALQMFPALFSFIFLLGLTSSSAQSLGDLARQERERLRNSSDKPNRVFTNEDLARPKILEQQELDLYDAQTRTASSSSPASVLEEETTVKRIAVPVWPKGTPLGDVARYYRQLKASSGEPVETPVLVQDAPNHPGLEQRALFSPSRQKLPSPRQSAPKPELTVAIPKHAVRDTAPVPGVIRVSAGDSLWKLASRHLGDGKQWTQIALANPEIADPNLIQVDQQIRLPGAMAAESTAVAEAPSQVRVQPGDSLWKLAETRWGTGLAWSCIAESNPQIQDSSKIYPGQTLALPASCSSSI